MSYESVIKAHEKIDKIDLFLSNGSDLAICAMVIAGIVVLLGILLNGGEMFLQFLAVVLFLLSCVIIDEQNNREKELKKEKLKEWEEVYVKPYIEGLPKYKIDVDKFTISNGDSEGNFTGDVDYEVVNFMGKEDGYLVEKKWKVEIKEKDGIEKAYITYRKLTKDIFQFKKGIYNAVLYVPKKS